MTHSPLLAEAQAALAPAALLDPIIERIRRARAIQVVGHLRPDGDCIGSLLGMHHLLEHWGIPHALAVERMPDNGYGVLPGFDRIAGAADPTLAPDLAVYVDCANRERGLTGWTPPADTINIDHHGSNSRYGQWNWIEPRAAAAGEMLFYLAAHAGVPLTPPLAEALLVAITTDTGSFRFSNTGAVQHALAAALIAAGARADFVARAAFGSMGLPAARLMGHVLENIQTDAGGRLAWSQIRKETYAALGGEEMAPENLSDCVRQVRGVEIGLLFHEIEGKGIRANFRSTGAVDVCRLAATWGGGGHAAAAGLTVESGDYDSLRLEIIARAIALLEGAS